MTAEIIDGKQIALHIREELKNKILQMEEKPGLAVVLVGTNPASKVYVNMKDIACKEVGIFSEKIIYDDDVSQERLIETVMKLNEDSKIQGILVQLPLPDHIDERKVIEAITPEKDVDGFHPLNTGYLHVQQKTLVPCTPRGIIKLIKSTGIDLVGKHAVVVGRSNIVGRPIAELLQQENCTITICHSKSRPLEQYTRQADILIVAVGKPHLVTENMIKPGAVVIDVGVNRVDDLTSEKGYKLVGDVDFNNAKKVASHITPVPGGVGPMTIACLMENTYIAAGGK